MDLELKSCVGRICKTRTERWNLVLMCPRVWRDNKTEAAPY